MVSRPKSSDISLSVVFSLPPDDTFNFIVAMMYTQLFNLLCDKADDVYGGRLPVHVRCLLDEVANIGQIPKLENIELVAEKGTCAPYLQDTFAAVHDGYFILAHKLREYWEERDAENRLYATEYVTRRGLIPQQ